MNSRRILEDVPQCGADLLLAEAKCKESLLSGLKSTILNLLR